MADYGELSRQALGALDYRALYASLGLELAPGEPDAEGWIAARGCIFTTGDIFVTLKEQKGIWREPISNKIGNLFYLVQAQRGLAKDDTVALRFLCKHAGIEFPGDEEIPKAGEAIALTVAQQIRDAVSGQLVDQIFSHTGLSPYTLKKYRMGQARFKGKNFLTLPIPDATGQVTSARNINESYRGKWMQRWPEGGPLDESPRIYGLDEMREFNWPNVVVVNNEIDRMLLMQTKGKEAEDWGVLAILDYIWLEHWIAIFENRAVILCYSSEPRTQTHVQQVIGARLDLEREKGRVKSLRIVKMPLIGTPDDCRIYHWFKQGGTWQALQKKAAEFVIPGRGSKTSEIKQLESFAEIDDPANWNMPVRVPVAVTGETAIVFDSPIHFRVAHCGWMKAGKCNECLDRTFPIEPGREEHIMACNSSREQVEKICQNICCQYKQYPKIEILEKGTFREIIATQYYSRMVHRENEEHENNPLIDGRYERLIERKVFVRVPNGSPGAIQPRGYWATGWVRTNPKNSHRTMLIETLQPIPDAYESFDYSTHLDELLYLRKLGWSGIAQDLVAHRTKIFGNDELILIDLLAFCSPLHLRFNGELIRGWVTAAVIGDTGVGKSRTFEALSEILGTGDIFSCLTGRRTGLTYSVINRGQRWQCQAGLQPLNTRRILCIEEAQALPREELKGMAEAMEKGLLLVNLVARESYETKTRIVFNANPPNGRTIEHYPFGCMALKELFIPAFIRRLDMVAFVRKLDDNEKYNAPAQVTAAAQVSPEAFRSLVYFAWTLTPERVVFSDEITALILGASNRLSDVFGNCDDIPLVLPSVYRFVLARLCAAWAVLDLSSTDSLKTIEIKPEHVALVEGFLTKLYTSPACGLDRYSKEAVQHRSLADYDTIEENLRKWLSSKGDKNGTNPYGRLLHGLNMTHPFKRAELAKLTEMTDGWTSSVLALLLACSMVVEDEDGRIVTTPKYQRVMARFERSHPIEAGIIRASGKMEPGNETDAGGSSEAGIGLSAG